MIESSNATLLGSSVIDSVVMENILQIIDNTLLMSIERYYFFSSRINGYSLGQAYNNTPSLRENIMPIENLILASPMLPDMYISERGIAINRTTDTITGYTNPFHELDYTIRQIRITLRGLSTFADTILLPGCAYIIDNVSPGTFTASPNTVQLVFNCLEKNSKKPWELWSPHASKVGE